MTAWEQLTLWAAESSPPGVPLLHRAVDVAAAHIRMFKPSIDELYKAADPKLVGKLDVRREKTVFSIRGRLAPLMIGMIAAGIP